MNDMTLGRNSMLNRVARGLGWFSVALGVVEVLAPRKVAETAEIEIEPRVLTAYGARELAAGIGLLYANSPAPWLWGRVGGDALDLATLVFGRQLSATAKGRWPIALAAVISITTIDTLSAVFATKNARK
jgi:hypothetical protein